MAQMSAEGAFEAIVDAGWGVVSSGAFEAVTGRCTVVEIPAHDGERAEMREAVLESSDAGMFDTLESGWYFVSQFQHQPLTYEKCKNRDYAFARYALTRSAYEEWEDKGLH